MSTGRHVLDDLPAYALGVLEGEEKRQVDDHLAECSVCLAELREMTAVVELLPLAAPVRQAPDRVRARVLAEATRARAPASAPLPAARTESRWERLTALFRGISPAWGIAGLALVLVLALSNVLLLRQIQQNQADPGPTAFQVVDLNAPEPGGEGRGVLVVSPDGRYGTLVVDGLEPLSPDQEYQLWLNAGEERDSGGVFSVGASGYGALKISSPRPLTEYEAFGVTVEPQGGSPAPTGARVLAGSF